MHKIKHEINEEEELNEAMAIRRKELKAKKLLEPKVLGRHKYQAPDIEVNLSEDITGNMRGLKVEGKFIPNFTRKGHCLV